MNHETIWLSPICEDECPEGRQWSQDDPGRCDGCGAPSVKYIRADIIALIEAAALEFDDLGPMKRKRDGSL